METCSLFIVLRENVQDSDAYRLQKDCIYIRVEYSYFSCHSNDFGSDVNKDLGPKAKAKDLVPESRGHGPITSLTINNKLPKNEMQIRKTAEMVSK